MKNCQQKFKKLLSYYFQAKTVRKSHRIEILMAMCPLSSIWVEFVIQIKSQTKNLTMQNFQVCHFKRNVRSSEKKKKNKKNKILNKLGKNSKLWLSDF